MVDTMVKRGIVEKVLYVECDKPDFCIELIEKVDEELSAQATVYAEMRGSKILFRIVGFEPNVQRTMIKLREIINLVKRLRTARPRAGISAEELAKFARRAVPLDVLAKVLRVQGVYAEVRGPTIYADTDLNTLISLAQALGEALEKLSKMPLGHGLKKLVAAAMVLTGLNPMQILQRAKEIGVVNELNELVEDWEKALDKLLEAIHTGIEGEELEEV